MTGGPDKGYRTLRSVLDAGHPVAERRGGLVAIVTGDAAV